MVGGGTVYKSPPERLYSVSSVALSTSFNLTQVIRELL